MTAILVTAVGLNAAAGTTGPWSRGGHHSSGDVEYDADVEQRCEVNIEFSEVYRSDACTPDASVTQSGTSGRGHRGGDVEYDADVEQKCDVNIEFSRVKDSDICTPKADIRQGAYGKTWDGGGHEGGSDHNGGGYDHKDGGYDHRDGGHKGSVTITNQEKTTCEADGLIALNQCDVGGDATAFGGGGDEKSHGRDGGWYGGREDSSRVWYGHGNVDYTNQEKTTCKAYGFLALNQCDVEGDASALSLSGLKKPLGTLGGLGLLG